MSEEPGVYRVAGRDDDDEELSTRHLMQWAFGMQDKMATKQTSELAAMVLRVSLSVEGAEAQACLVEAAARLRMPLGLCGPWRLAPGLGTVRIKRNDMGAYYHVSGTHSLMMDVAIDLTTWLNKAAAVGAGPLPQSCEKAERSGPRDLIIRRGQADACITADGPFDCKDVELGGDWRITRGLMIDAIERADRGLLERVEPRDAR
jgi:hypothetical protein